MTEDDVIKINASKRRVRALEHLIDLFTKNGRNASAGLAQRELQKLKREIYQRYDIRL